VSARPAIALALVLVAAACAEGDPVGTTSSSGASTSSSGTGGPVDCSGKTDCDGTCADLATDPLNCGACGRTCVVANGDAICVGSDCAVGACANGFADCDDDPLTGCEVAVDCQEGGACTTTCGSMGGLACADACAPVCNPLGESCNAVDDDCDGACDQGAIAGCRVPVHRAYNGSNGHLFTTDLAEAQAWGLEAQNFFYLYAGAAADLRPFFRCPKAGIGNFLFSDSTDCEGTAAPLFTVGFIAPQPMMGEPTCGAIPLYRIYLPGNGWHFYTTSLAERDNALANGWVDQGLAGYVWTGP
jgi:hypothetical protein